MSQLDDYIARAGAGAVLMVADGETLEDVRRNTPAAQWGHAGQTYRGAAVEIHDEWAWGWMVRKADGTYVTSAPNPLIGSQGE